MVGHIREVLHNVKRKQLQSGACHRSNIFRFYEDSVSCAFFFSAKEGRWKYKLEKMQLTNRDLLTAVA